MAAARLKGFPLLHVSGAPTEGTGGVDVGPGESLGCHLLCLPLLRSAAESQQRAPPSARASLPGGYPVLVGARFLCAAESGERSTLLPEAKLK